MDSLGPPLIEGIGTQLHSEMCARNVLPRELLGNIGVGHLLPSDAVIFMGEPVTDQELHLDWRDLRPDALALFTHLCTLREGSCQHDLALLACIRRAEVDIHRRVVLDFTRAGFDHHGDTVVHAFTLASSLCGFAAIVSRLWRAAEDASPGTVLPLACFCDDFG
jgi:hypothetical protein